MAADDVPCCEPMFWGYLFICVALVIFSGLVSGLTLGLMSLDLVDLEVLVKSGQPQERKNAAWVAILISVTLVLAFGEIIPHAVCSKYALTIGAELSVVVRLLVLVLFPISYPISKLLDLLLGKGHSALFRRAELKTLVDMHRNEAGKGGELTQDEGNIIAGALDMTQKTAKDAMKPISEIFSLDIDSKLNEETMGLILSKGHSRVPIYSGNQANIIGLILVKNLIKCRPEDETPVRNLTIRRIPRVQDSLPLYDIMSQFQKGHSHMAVVVKCKKDVKGAAENSNGISTTFEININSNPKEKQAEKHGIDYQFSWNEQLHISRYESSVNTSDTESQSPTLNYVMERGRDMRPKVKKWERHDENFLHEELDSLPNLDEEVIGIITMENVIEELLQEEILDETDEYVDVHNKIKINMFPSRRSSPGSLRAAFANHLHWRTLEASPLSSYHHTPATSYNHTPILRSPISPYIPPPFIRPTLITSPGHSIPNAKAGFAGPVFSSPSSRQVSRKSYEKLRHSGPS
ncbi:hypothetical protein L1049_020927 [Liquidambar formosana]|uniref:CNNM transmembrane domain-containing protein n=1 Tax=Liquidambar formosana TaxID=63359 RepID=A0AAP0XB21_LIQFO